MTQSNMPPNTPTLVDPSAAAKPAPRKRRRWPWVILALFVLLILLILLGPTIASTSAVRSIVVSKINDRLNGKLDITDWSIGWTSGVTVTGIKLDDDKGRRIVEVSSVKVPASLIGLARGNYDFGEITIDKPTVLIGEMYNDGGTNFDKLPKQPAEKKPAPKSTEPSKLPDIKGKIVITGARGTIAFPDSNRPPISLDPSDITIDIPGINQAITDKIALAFHVGSAPPGTVAIEGNVNAIQNNVVNVDQLKADQTIQLSGVDLSAFAPFLKSSGGNIDLAGLARGTLHVKADTIKSATVGGLLSVDNLAVSGTPLKGDTYKSKVLNIPINVAVTPVGQNDSLVKIEKLQVESDHVLVDVSGQATQSALQNLAKQQAPGSDGAFAVAVTSNDIPGLASSLRHTLGLADDVKIESGKFATHVNLTLDAKQATVKQNLDFEAAGSNAGKAIKLDPVHLDTAVTAIPTGKSIPDLREVALNLTSAFATAAGGGKSLDDLDIHGDFDLAKLQSQLAQFQDLAGKSVAGTGKFQITSKGNLTTAGGNSAVTATVNLDNIVAHGIAKQGDIAQPHVLVDAKANLQRGATDQDGFIAAIPSAQLIFQSGDPQSPVVDVLVTATKVTLAKLGVEQFQLQKLSIPDLPRVQQQFAAFMPPDLRAASGSINVTASGSYLNNTLQFDQKAELRAVTLQKVDANKQVRTLLDNETEDIATAGSVQQVDKSTNTITLNTLSATSSNKLFTVIKSPDQPLVIKLHATDKGSVIAGNGNIAISSDLKRVLDALQAFSSAPAPAPNAPGQLTGGTFNANLKLAQDDKGGSINLDGGIDNLSVTTNAAPIANEKVAINVAATTPPDLSSIAVSFATINSSFAKTTISDTLLQLKGGTFDMLQKASGQIAIPDINKAMTVAQALTPPSTQPATTQPLVIGGGAVVAFQVARDAASQTTNVTLSQIAASKVSLVRGQRSYAFDKPINMKLVASLATENVTTPASTRPTQQIKQINVTQLEGDIGGLSSISMPTPLVVNNLTATTPSANGKIAVSGSIEPLMLLLSVIQNANEMPYRGDYVVNQTIATQSNAIKLTGDTTVNNLVVLQADNKTPEFSEAKLIINDDLVADTTAKSATINNLALDMTSSKAASVVVKGSIQDWEVQRKFTGVTCDLSYDLAKLWLIAKPMLSPQSQQSLADLKVSGVYKKTFTLSGSLPASQNGKPLAFNESIKSLSADGAFAFDHFYSQGLDVGTYELPITLTNGVFTTLYAGKPKGQRAPKPAVCNGGSLDLGSFVCDLTSKDMLLSTPKNQQLLKDVQLNKVLADAMGKYAAVIFKDSSAAGGLLNVVIVECDKVPLSEAIKSRNAGKAKVTVAIKNLNLNGPVALAIASLCQLGSDGIVGEVRDSYVSYADAQTLSDFSIFLTRKGVQVPLRFSGGIGMEKLDLRNAELSIPAELIGDKNVARGFPEGIKVPITGTTEKYKIADIGTIIKQNLGGFVGGLLGGGNNHSTTNKATGDNKGGNDIGNAINDIFGGSSKKKKK